MLLCFLRRQVVVKQLGSSRENMASRKTVYPAGHRLYPLARMLLSKTNI